MAETVIGRTIDLEILRNNVREIRRAVPETARLLAVVKADAYGHGAVQVARAALEAGASFLAIALVKEGIPLREAGITAPILVLGAAVPEDVSTALKYDLTLTLTTAAVMPAMAAACDQAGKQLQLHLKLDTGMSRIGVRTEQEVQEVLSGLERYPQLKLKGVFTHFADCDGDDMAFTYQQLAKFRQLSSLLPAGVLRHCANSAAIHRLMPEAAFDMVRMGISMYGYPPVPTDMPLQPFMSWTTRVTWVKTLESGDTVSYGRTYRAEGPVRLATVAIGYGDGYHRAGTGKAEVIIRGKRCRVLGRICMDQCMADVTDVPDAAPGDQVTLIGSDGSARLDAEDLARWAGTISYEILLAATGRVARTWLHE